MFNSTNKNRKKDHSIKVLYTAPAIALFLLCVITSILTWEKEDFGIGVCLMIFLCVIFTVFSIIAMIAMYREIGRFRAREFTRETDKTLYESEKNKKELEQVKTELEQVKTELEQVKKEKELLYNDSLYHICVDFRNAKAELEQSENELEQVEIKQQMLKEIKVIREKSQEVRKKINEINKQFSDTDETGTKVPNEG